jgi:hypothetical protein
METQPAVYVCGRKVAHFAGKTRFFAPKIFTKAGGKEAATLRFPSAK